MAVERPPIVEDIHLDFLDVLRDSGVCNMFGASSYIMEEFETSSQDAKAILMYWMETFGNEER